MSYLACHAAFLAANSSLWPPCSLPESELQQHHHRVTTSPKRPPAGTRNRMETSSNPGCQSSVHWRQKCFEVSFCNLVDGWKEWEGTSREESVEFHWKMRWLPLFLTGLGSHYKKSPRGAANYRLNFVDIFVSFFFSPWLLPSEALPSSRRQFLGNGLSCSAPETATVEPPRGWSWALPVSPCSLCLSREVITERSCIFVSVAALVQTQLIYFAIIFFCLWINSAPSYLWVFVKSSVILGKHWTKKWSEIWYK